MPFPDGRQIIEPFYAKGYLLDPQEDGNNTSPRPLPVPIFMTKGASL